MKFRFRLYFPWLLLLTILIFLIAGSLFSDGYYGGADNLSHWFISRYSINYPELFLNPWGRPLYTTLSAPFAQAGLHGSKIFNILTGIATAYFAWRIAAICELRPSWMVILLVLFPPIYFVMMPTALTEILFGFLLILAAFLYFRKHVTAATIVISFLPFVRTEGFILLPLYLIALIRSGKLKTVLFLVTGTLIFSIAGSFHYSDIFWVITRFPYPVNYHHPVYSEEGTIFHFLRDRYSVFGFLLEFLFILGTIRLLYLWAHEKQAMKRLTVEFILLILLPFLVYLILHSLLYRFALGGSLGLHRVMAAVIPAAALVAMQAVSWMNSMTKKTPVLRNIIFTIIFIPYVALTFWVYPFPYRLSPEEEVIRNTVSWIQHSEFQDRFIYYADINVPFRLDVDPYAYPPPRCSLFAGHKSFHAIKTGSLVIWDAHFGANESGIPEDTLLTSPHLKVLRQFQPVEPWITLGGELYKAYVLLAVPPSEHYDNYLLLDSISEAEDQLTVQWSLFYESFENNTGLYPPWLLARDTVFRGTHSCRMDGQTEFSPGLVIPVTNLETYENKVFLTVSIYVLMPVKQPDLNTLLVVSFEDQGKSFSYSAESLNGPVTREGTWCRVKLIFDSCFASDFIKC